MEASTLVVTNAPQPDIGSMPPGWELGDINSEIVRQLALLGCGVHCLAVPCSAGIYRLGSALCEINMCIRYVHNSQKICVVEKRGSIAPESPVRPPPGNWLRWLPAVGARG